MKTKEAVEVMETAMNVVSKVSPMYEALGAALDELRWNPVTERLPDEEGQYLCTWVYTNDEGKEITGVNLFDYGYKVNEIWKEDVFEDGSAFGEAWPSKDGGIEIENVCRILAWKKMPERYER